MFIRWQKYRSVAKWHRPDAVASWRKHPDGPPITRVKAVLVKSVRIDGKPRLKHIAFIASYDEDYRKRNEVGCRCTFWRWARQRLKQLKLTPKQRRQVEVMLAKRMKPPTKREQVAHDREYAALMASFGRSAA